MVVVLEAMIADGAASVAIFAIWAFFKSTRSKTASMIKSQWAKPSNLEAQPTRFSKSVEVSCFKKPEWRLVGRSFLSVEEIARKPLAKHRRPEPRNPLEQRCRRSRCPSIRPLVPRFVASKHADFATRCMARCLMACRVLTRLMVERERRTARPLLPFEANSSVY